MTTYILYFSGVGKATFFNIFLQHAEFITSIHHLSQTDTSVMKIRFLSFFKLIDTMYFKNNLFTMVSKLGFETPNQLFNSMKPGNDEDQHRQWYKTIKGAICIVHEDQRPPTLTALWRHWIRSCWIKTMWANSTKQDVYNQLLLPEMQGWSKTDSGYMIDWKDTETMKKIHFLNNRL